MKGVIENPNKSLVKLNSNINPARKDFLQVPGLNKTIKDSTERERTKSLISASSIIAQWTMNDLNDISCDG